MRSNFNDSKTILPEVSKKFLNEIEALNQDYAKQDEHIAIIDVKKLKLEHYKNVSFLDYEIENLNIKINLTSDYKNNITNIFNKYIENWKTVFDNEIGKDKIL
jgi:hypothetical protein